MSAADLFALRERILVHERIVARHEKRVLKSLNVNGQGWRMRTALDELRVAQKRLADLRGRLANEVREVMS